MRRRTGFVHAECDALVEAAGGTLRARLLGDDAHLVA